MSENLGEATLGLPTRARRLRIRVVDSMMATGSACRRRIEVIDPLSGEVLGDLAESTAKLTWSAEGPNLATVTIELAAENCEINTIMLNGDK